MSGEEGSLDSSTSVADRERHVNEQEGKRNQPPPYILPPSGGLYVKGENLEWH